MGPLAGFDVVERVRPLLPVTAGLFLDGRVADPGEFFVVGGRRDGPAGTTARWRLAR